VLLFLAFCWLPLRAETGTRRKIELAVDWKLASAAEARVGGAEVSVAGYEDASRHPIHRTPATVLEILQEDGVYTDLYVGKNLLEKASGPGSSHLGTGEPNYPSRAGEAITDLRISPANAVAA